MCDLIYRGRVPPDARQYLRDTYLFCLHKDPGDPSKLRPLGIPLALRRLVASHVAISFRHRFARHLLPYNFAVGVGGGMDFIVKAMQLAINRYIKVPQAAGVTPTRAALFVDFKNMFNLVSRKALFAIVSQRYPELLPLLTLLYSEAGTVHLKWADGSWRTISMFEGLNQGCPLSVVFAIMVLHEVLAPLDDLLQERAAVRLAAGDWGDDGHGSVTHLMGYVDDVSAMVPLVDLEFCWRHLKRMGDNLGLFFNAFKTRILTSCDGTSTVDKLERRCGQRWMPTR